jgi:hypothetical protein
MPLVAGTRAPEIPGILLGGEPRLLFFYKVTCPVCQMAAPKLAAFERGYSGMGVGIGQDPAEELQSFSRRHGLAFGSVEDLPPYPASVAYRVVVVPTTFLVGSSGEIADVVESWDRDGLNRLSRGMAGLMGEPYVPISEAGDGLPPFRPG